MATILLTTEEAQAAMKRHLAIKARANFLFKNAVHNRRRAEYAWSEWRKEEDLARETRMLALYNRALELFYRRMHEQRDLLIETSKQLYLQG
jgi:hypothetical protein